MIHDAVQWDFRDAGLRHGMDAKEGIGSLKLVDAIYILKQERTKCY